MNSSHTYTHKPDKMSAPTAYISETRTVPKNCLHLTTVCVHWTRNFRFTKPWHIKPPYITLCLIKKKLPLRLCNTQNKCVHIYSISVTWWQQVIGFDIADGSISMMSHLLNYTWERCFLPWSWETCDRLMVICFTLQLSNCHLIHETEVLNFVWTIKFLSIHLFMEGEGELGVSSLKKINQNFEFDLSHLV